MAIRKTSTVAHTSALSQSSPIGTDFGQVCQFQRHAQRDFSEFGMIVLHELDDLFALFRSEIVVLEQITFAEDLSDTQDLITGGVQREI